MSWYDLGVEGKHRIWICGSCKRKAVTGAGVLADALGKCAFCHPDQTAPPLVRRRRK